MLQNCEIFLWNMVKKIFWLKKEKSILPSIVEVPGVAHSNLTKIKVCFSLGYSKGTHGFPQKNVSPYIFMSEELYHIDKKYDKKMNFAVLA